MPTAKHLKALLDAHASGDDQRFFSIAMQAAAHEAKMGHGQLADELRGLIDSAKSRRQPAREVDRSLVPIGRPRGELSELLAVSYPKARLSDMVLDESVADQLRRVIREHRHSERIVEHGLSPRRKLLMVGAPGTGKTLTAAVLAGELGMPLFQVRLDGLLTKFMGETAAKLRQIFDAMGSVRGIYFFDEFDAIGSQRGLTNDVGEIRRVLNSFLQLIEHDRSLSLILAATNHPEILDYALLRRFDDVLHYALPNAEQASVLLKSRLSRLVPRTVAWAKLGKRALGLSYAEINRAAEDVHKEALIGREKAVRSADIERMLDERQTIAGRLRKQQ